MACRCFTAWESVAWAVIVQVILVDTGNSVSDFELCTCYTGPVSGPKCSIGRRCSHQKPFSYASTILEETLRCSCVGQGHRSKPCARPL